EKTYSQMLTQALQATARSRSGEGAELTGVVQSCIALWESGLSSAVVDGGNVSRDDLAMAARWLALEGNAVFLIDGDKWRLCSDWDCKAVAGEPVAYRVSLPGTFGPVAETALAGEVLHFRIGCRLREPWRGTSPLSRAPLSGGLLAVVEGVLSDTYDSAPIGSQIVTTPEDPEDENGTIGASFRGKRGRVLLRETSAILAAGGPTPQSDWSPRDMTPDIARAGLPASHALTRSGLVSCFGVLPALLD